MAPLFATAAVGKYPAPLVKIGTRPAAEKKLERFPLLSLKKRPACY